MTAQELAAELEAIRQELSLVESEQAQLATKADALRRSRHDLLDRFAEERRLAAET
jgi:predicted nuclease with TOPRIM domain